MMMTETISVEVPMGCVGGEIVAVPHRGKEISITLPRPVIGGQIVQVPVASGGYGSMPEDQSIPNDAPEIVKVYCDMAVRRPLATAGGCCGCIYLLVILAVVLQWPLMSEPGQEDWIVADSELSRQFDALADAEKQVIGEGTGKEL
jgi:hypothetical protein